MTTWRQQARSSGIRSPSYADQRLLGPFVGPTLVRSDDCSCSVNDLCAPSRLTAGCVAARFAARSRSQRLGWRSELSPALSLICREKTGVGVGIPPPTFPLDHFARLSLSHALRLEICFSIPLVGRPSDGLARWVQPRPFVLRACRSPPTRGRAGERASDVGRRIMRSSFLACPLAASPRHGLANAQERPACCTERPGSSPRFRFKGMKAGRKTCSSSSTS
jgi:hypothetical protein